MPIAIDISDDEDIFEVSDDEDLGLGHYDGVSLNEENNGWDSDDEELNAAIRQSLLDKKPRSTPPRNPPVQLPLFEIPFADIRDALPVRAEDKTARPADKIVRPGDTVELKIEAGSNVSNYELQSGDFLRVRSIIRNLETDEVILRGLRFRRAEHMGGTFEKRLNELVLLLLVDQDDNRPVCEQAMEDFKIGDVVRKRELIITNARYPRMSFLEQDIQFMSLFRKDKQRQVHDHERLVCRHVQVVIWDNATLRKSRPEKHYGGEIRVIYPHEADHPVEDHGKGEGSANSPFQLDDDNEVSHKHNQSKNTKRAAKQQPSVGASSPNGSKRLRPAVGRKAFRYKFADAFHGAGGASRGAQMAGLEIDCGFDNNSLVCQAYMLNFPEAKSFCMDAADFPPKHFDILKRAIDIMHFSPPCQPWSPAHTRDGPHDEANVAALFTIGPLLKKCNPRIATLEQTAGLITHHKGYLEILFNQFLDAGYNLRWRREILQNFGVPQRRSRLILIAARQDVPLPPLPKRTHGDEGTGFKPFATIRDALWPLQLNPPQDDYYHEQAYMRELKEVRYLPYSPDEILKATITTGGGMSAQHYSGKGYYTVRELAALQTFPLHHQFTGSQTDAKRQVGNAAPPVYMMSMFDGCIKTLSAFDAGKISAGYTIILSDGEAQEMSSFQQLRRIPNSHDLTNLVVQEPTPMRISRSPASSFGSGRGIGRSAPLRPPTRRALHSDSATKRVRNAPPIIVEESDEEDLRPTVPSGPRRCSDPGTTKLIDLTDDFEIIDLMEASPTTSSRRAKSPSLTPVPSDVEDADGFIIV